jgi:hypothetical protein
MLLQLQAIAYIASAPVVTRLFARENFNTSIRRDIFHVILKTFNDFVPNALEK